MIELLIALSIALVIASVGVQLFSSVTEKAKTSEARRSLERAVVAQLSYAGSNSGYASSAEEFASLPSGRGIDFTLANSTSRSSVSVSSTEDNGLSMAVYVSEGLCLGVVLSDPYVDGDVGPVVEFDGVCSGVGALSLE